MQKILTPILIIFNLLAFAQCKYSITTAKGFNVVGFQNNTYTPGQLIFNEKFDVLRKSWTGWQTEERFGDFKVN